MKKKEDDDDDKKKLMKSRSKMNERIYIIKQLPKSNHRIKFDYIHIHTYIKFKNKIEKRDYKLEN